MKNQTDTMPDFLLMYKAQLDDFIGKPGVSAPIHVMKKIRSAVELAIELVNSGRKIEAHEKDLFEGGSYLARYFDGWGEMYFDNYLKMVHYVQKHHY